MTDNTQELDDILYTLAEKSADSDSSLGYVEAYEFAQEAKQAIIDWHNARIEELLDRLWQHSEVMNSAVVPAYGVPLSAIEAERNKLKESV